MRLRGLPGALPWGVRGLRSSSGLALACVALAACNALTGASDLQFASETTPVVPDASVRDGAGEASLPGRDASVADVVVDAPPDGALGACPGLTATTLLGSATPLGAFFQLTPETNNLAGGIASASQTALDDFAVSFAYSMTYTSANVPAAGLAFFAIGTTAKNLECKSGPYLCPLGASSPGFAIILRTSKAAAGDPEVPYVAVVDAQSYPNVVPSNPTPVDPTKAYTLVQQQGAGLPPEPSFHLVTISITGGLVDVSVDGAPLLAKVVAPNWLPGRLYTWGLGASTGLGASFATRTVVSQPTFTRCP